MNSESVDTLPKLLVQNGEKYGKRRTAIREKEYGIWQSVSWVDYLNQVKEFYLGLTAVGQLKSYRDIKHYKRRKRWLS